MARKTTVTLVDDYDPEQAAEETVTFGLDGNSYEIDLSSKNAAALRGDLQKWVSPARRVGRYGRRLGSRPSEHGLNLAEIRKWAKDSGRKVSERGRVSAEIVREYRKAHDPAVHDPAVNAPADQPASPKKTAAKKAAAEAPAVEAPAFSAKT